MCVSDVALRSPKRLHGRERRASEFGACSGFVECCAGAVQAAPRRESADGRIETPSVRSCPKRLATAVTGRAAKSSAFGGTGQARPRTRAAPRQLNDPRRRTGRARSKPKARNSIVANENVVSIDCFQRRYEPRPYRWTGQEAKESERIPLKKEHGLRILGPAPAREVQLGKPPSGRGDRGNNRYLWVIDACGIPYIAERPQRDLKGNKGNLPKHTNLTGGGEAYVGGELWFASDDSLYVSGGSGRYPPIDSRQLELAVGVFRHYGYKATSLGWDDAPVPGGRAKRHWEGSQ